MLSIFVYRWVDTAQGNRNKLNEQQRKVTAGLHQTFSNHFLPVPIGEGFEVQEFVVCSADGSYLLFMSLFFWISCVTQHV
jgi:hypothetical protein